VKCIDPEDDALLLLHSTRCSERSVDDCWSQCHALIGKPEVAVEYYEKLEKKIDLNMTRMRARQYIQHAEALYCDKDLSCCFYLSQGIELAHATGSRYNMNRARELIQELLKGHKHDIRVKDLLQEVRSLV